MKHRHKKVQIDCFKQLDPVGKADLSPEANGSKLVFKIVGEATLDFGYDLTNKEFTDYIQLVRAKLLKAITEYICEEIDDVQRRKVKNAEKTIREDRERNLKQLAKLIYS